MTSMSLNLDEVADPDHGLSPKFGASIVEAASVCFEQEAHRSGVPLRLTGLPTGICHLWWSQLHPNALASWNDTQVATEWGAYGVAILLSVTLLKLRITQRSRKGTRFDFFLMQRGQVSHFLQDAEVRLEVSGIRNGTSAEVEGRLREKYKRFRRVSAGALIAVVVEFGLPLSRLVHYRAGT
jgi:hypothetical protein